MHPVDKLLLESFQTTVGTSMPTLIFLKGGRLPTLPHVPASLYYRVHDNALWSLNAISTEY